ncbi:thioredoxin family protein [Carboxylicivirga taeanensis]|uniref:thioredoxin family protein n=1 Tax=Carboxylicivirga taeanensis TaxID=1416875 RepID=UPI003F6DFB6F
MKKILLSVLILMGAFVASAQSGIKFEDKSFDEVCALAKKQNKLVFVDVYTQWCGPCLAMAEEVFTLTKVGEIMNEKFVSVKIDAEHGEGVDFAKKYKVRSFPTYYFIDPNTKEVLHRSGGRHEADKFLKIVANSMEPKLRSTYLYTEYEKGNRDPEFMLDYIDGMALSYDRNNLAKAIDELVAIKGDDLTDDVLGELFFEHINDRNHPLFKKFVAKRAKMEKKYGKERVDQKLYQSYRWCNDEQELNAVGDFKGKDYIITYNKLRSKIEQKEYAAADALVMEMFANSSFDQKVVMNDIKFIGRRIFYKEADKEWEQYCVKYLQYIAYNDPERKEAENHYNYARILEKIIKDNPDIHKYFPASVTQEPETGKTQYTMRSSKLKQKPRR